MKKQFNLASRLIVAAIVLSAHCAYASDDSSKKSFEDGLKASVTSPKESESKHASEQYVFWKEIEDGLHVTMVPEPATDAMLLAGFAVLLVAARRKQIFKGR